MIEGPHPFPQLERAALSARAAAGDIPIGGYADALLEALRVRCAICFAVRCEWRARRDPELSSEERLNMIMAAEERFGRYGRPDQAWIDGEAARQIAESDRLAAVMGAD